MCNLPGWNINSHFYEHVLELLYGEAVNVPGGHLKSIFFLFVGGRARIQQKLISIAMSQVHFHDTRII